MISHQLQTLRVCYKASQKEAIQFTHYNKTVEQITAKVCSLPAQEEVGQIVLDGGQVDEAGHACRNEKAITEGR